MHLPWGSLRLRAAKDYGLAVVITLSALLARFLLEPFIGDQLPYVTFFAGVALATFCTDLGPSLAAVILGGLAADYFFLEPRYSFVLVGQANYVGLTMYLLTTLAIVGFGQTLRAFRRHAERITSGLQQEIVVRERVELALRESETRFRSVANTAPVMIWMSDMTKRCIWFNKAWLEFTGRTMDDELGEGWMELVHAEDLAQCLQVYESAFDARETFTMEYRLRRRDQEYRWLLDQGCPRLDPDGTFLGYIGSCVDITERRRAEAQLVESEERFRTLADNMSQFAWMADASGWLFWYNRRWYEYTGTTYEEMKGWGWQKVHHPDYLDHVMETWRKAHATGEPWEDTFPLRGKDGMYRWFLSRAVPIRDNSGSITRWFGTNTDITELRNAHAALKQSEARYRALYDSIDEGFCIIEVMFDEHMGAVDFRFLETNPAFERQTGIQNARGQRMREIAPQHEMHWFDLFGTIALSGEPKRFEYPAVELHRWYEGYAYRVGEEYERKVGIIFNDITVRKQAEEKLRQSEQRLRLALSAGQMGAWDIDLLTGSVTWDARQCDLFGMSKTDEPVDMNKWYELVHPDDVGPLRAATARAETTGSFACEFRIVQPHSAERWIAGVGATLKNETGQAVRMVGLNYDITERRKTEADLRTSAEELEHVVQARTQELVLSQERLRSLAAQLNLAEQRERKRLAGELHDSLAQWLVLCQLYLGQVSRGSLTSDVGEKIRQTEDLLNQALNYSRTLIAELSPRVLQDHGLVAGLTWLGEEMQRHGLAVRVVATKGVETTLSEDSSVLLFQSVRELLMNALKHARCNEVVVRLHRDEGNLCIEVQDDGVGFIATSNADETLSSKFGLFSIQERMTALGGMLNVQSRPGYGTIARLLLPLTSSATGLQPVKGGATVIQAHSDSAPPSLNVTAPIRTLLVDDHPMMRQGLRSLLTTFANIDVVGEASDGQEAVELAERLRPRLIIMDVNMPRMNGIEATAVIKSRLTDTSVIGLSVHASPETDRAMRAAGAAILLPKETAAKALYQAIQKVLTDGLNIPDGAMGDCIKA
ncbi:MAG TPA: PAS domain S-box protein [Nitrospira sp.]|nr:PAS domain S-box protein [Nitrospira sp.]HNA85359.1 PAS domain S-box protein [Nitrospira sp.]